MPSKTPPKKPTPPSRNERMKRPGPNNPLPSRPPEPKGGGYGGGKYGEETYGSSTPSKDKKIKAKTAKLNIKGHKAKVTLTPDNLKTGKPILGKPSLKEQKSPKKKEKEKTVNLGLAEEKDTAGSVKAVKGKGKIYKQAISATAKGTVSIDPSRKKEKIISATGRAKASSTAKGVGSGDPPKPKPTRKKFFVAAIKENLNGLKENERALQEIIRGFKNLGAKTGDVVYISSPFSGEMGLKGRAQLVFSKNFIKIKTLFPENNSWIFLDQGIRKLAFNKFELEAPGIPYNLPFVFRIFERQARMLDKYMEKFEGSDPEPRDTRGPTFGDGATSKDHLGRTRMAETFAVRLKDMWKGNIKEEDNDPFIIHLNAPWGAGKTSFYKKTKEILEQKDQMEEEKLQEEKATFRAVFESNDSKSQKFKDFFKLIGKFLYTGEQQSEEAFPGKDDPPWNVINFNAWQHQHIELPWWSLLEAVFLQSRENLREQKVSPNKIDYLARQEIGRRLKAGRHLVLIGAFAFAALMFIWPDDPGLLETVTGTLAGLVGFGSLFYETLLGGSAKSAKAFQALSKDPQNRLKEHFQALIKDIDRPVLVFIDDIDRCQPKYVVGLLEGLMTIFRSNRCVFLIAGDARWIQKCFEVVYPDFIETSKKPGKTLGHHFLEKVFQFSLTLPAITKETMENFMAFLLKQDVEKQILAQGEGATKEIQKQLTEKVRQKAQKFEAEEIALDAAMEEFKNPEVEKKTRHLLMDYVDLMEPNPRNMKRLINAYIASAMAQASFQRGQLDAKDQNKLVLWTIFTHRWPLLEEYFIQNPNLIGPSLKFMKGQKSGVADVKDESILRPFSNHEDIKNLLKRDLDEDGIKFFLGLSGENL